MSLPRSIRALSVDRKERRAVLDGVSSTSHLSVFRLDVPEYQRQLARQVRKRSAERRNAAVAEETTEIEEYLIAN